MARSESLGEVFTPPALARHPEQSHRARTWIGICVLAGAIAGGFAGIHFNDSNWTNCAINAASALVLLGGAIYLQFSGHTKLVVHTCSAVCMAMALRSIVYPDSLSISSLALYTLVPLISTVAVGRKQGLPWTIVAMLMPPLFTIFRAGELRENFALLLALIILFAAIGAMMWNYEATGEEVRKERDDALEALAVAQQTTDDIITARSQFVKNVSHEFRAPLSKILGATQLLGQTQLNEEQRKLLNIAETTGNELLNIVNDAIAMQDLDQGSLKLEPQWLDIHVILNRVRRYFQPMVESKGLRFSIEVDPDIPERLFGDPGRIEQIHKNLLENAIAFTKKGSITVRANYLGEGRIRFEVEDSGDGIPHDKLERVFEPFFQLDTSDSRQHKGLGAGLSLSRRLARLMDGDVTAKSKPGSGSTFIFEAILREDKNYASNEKRRRVQKAKVIIAEGDAKTRVSFLTLLERNGIQAEAVSSQAELVHKLAERSVDIVFIDSRLPGNLGVSELVKQLRKRSRKPGPAYVSLVPPENLEGPAGFDDLVSRPIKTERVMSVLKRIEQIRATEKSS